MAPVVEAVMHCSQLHHARLKLHRTSRLTSELPGTCLVTSGQAAVAVGDFGNDSGGVRPERREAFKLVKQRAVRRDILRVGDKRRR